MCVFGGRGVERGSWVGLLLHPPITCKRIKSISTTRSTKRESWETEGTDATQSGTDVNLTKVIFESWFPERTANFYSVLFVAMKR